MAIRIEIELVNITEEQVNIKVREEDIEIIQGTTPGGRILADSDNLAFIYILDSDSDFIYISLKSDVWNALNEGMERSLPYILQYGDQQMELVAFADELEQRVNNIEGNANYGKTMVEEVEKIFFNK